MLSVVVVLSEVLPHTLLIDKPRVMVEQRFQGTVLLKMKLVQSKTRGAKSTSVIERALNTDLMGQARHGS